MSLLTSEVLNTFWAIRRETLTAIVAAIVHHDFGKVVLGGSVAAIPRPGRPSSISGSIQVLPVFGLITGRSSFMTEFFGGTSVEGFSAAFKQAVNDPSIGAIVLDVDSPGGTVDGVEELSSLIYRARGTKPIEAAVNYGAYSAAYWAITAADNVTVSPSGGVGSVGVYTAHEDWSKALEQAGINVELISEGEFKTEGHPYGPLSDEGRAYIQSMVSKFYNKFTSDVARNRGVPVASVKENYGKGRIVLAQDAKALGMADQVGTLDDVISRLQKRAKSAATAKADLDFRQRRARALTY